MLSDCGESLCDYWQDLLKGVNEPTHFSACQTSALHAAADTYVQVKEQTQKLSPEWMAGLQSLCADIGVDEAAVLTASWHWMLYQYSGERQVISGVSDSPCQTVIPAVSSFDDRSVTVSAWLRAMHEQLAASKQQIDFDGEAAGSMVALQPLLWPANIITSLLHIRHCDAGSLPHLQDNRGLVAGSELPAGLVASMLVEKESSWQATLTYSSAHFSAQQASYLLKDWVKVLTGLIQRRWQSVSELCAGEWQQARPVLRQDTKKDRMGELPSEPGILTVTLLAALQQAAREERTAIEWQPNDAGGCQIKVGYAALLHRVAEIQDQLAQHHVVCGDRVGLHVYRQPDMIAAMLACLFSGVTFVPLEPSFPAERLATIEQEAALKAIVQDASLAAEVSAVPYSCDAILLAEPDTTWKQPNSGRMPQLANELCADTPAYMMFTSGSTGKPKGVVIDHRALATFLQASTERLELDSSTRWLQITTMAFDIALLEIFAPLWVGGCAVLTTSEEYRDPHAVCRYLTAEHAITVLQATPAFWRMLLNTGWQGNSQLVALCGGEALDMPLARRLVARTERVWNCYGPTEATVWSLMAEVTADALQQATVVLQHSLAGYTHQVVDADSQPVSVNMVGELCIQGHALSQGYWQREALTNRQFVTLSPDSVRSYRTGDKVRRLGTDCYQYLGRFDDQVKLRGFRIELGEIEAQMKCQNWVKDAAVKLVGEGDDAQLVAFLEVDSAQSLPSKLAIRKALMKTLPNYMVPSRFVTVDVLPKTGSGKVDRKQLHA
ncbi:amino acid adenylation domain-containing protein [Photobacterium kasasachensis]|uniref:amino acid adenylation domain-containing protein n=1 Tax=Photobacterium kasasachensis TaxID=2910240 RepID=UPI003D0CC75E